MFITGKESLLVNQVGTITITPQTLDDLLFLHDELLAIGNTISIPQSSELNVAMMIVKVSPIVFSTPVITIKCSSTNRRGFVTVHIKLNTKSGYNLTKLWDAKTIALLDHTPDINVLRQTEASEKYDKFLEALESNSEKVCYGYEPVERACSVGAVETLMVNENLLRNGDVVIRKRSRSVVQLVRELKGEVLVFPSTHKKLIMMSGVASFLRFPFSYSG